jgi:hypothetical protein
MCGVKSLQQLLNCSSHLASHNIAHSIWKEPDMNDEPMALATQLISSKEKRPLRKYQLLNFPAIVNST